MAVGKRTTAARQRSSARDDLYTRRSSSCARARKLPLQPPPLTPRHHGKMTHARSRGAPPRPRSPVGPEPNRRGVGEARNATGTRLCLSLVPGDHESMDQRGVAQSGCPSVSFHWQHGASVARADGPEGSSLLSSDLGRGHPPHVVACHWLILPWFRYTPRG